MKQCRICNRDILISNARVLCGRRSCDIANRKIWQQISKKEDQAKVLAKGKKCKRCNKLTHESGMKKYCKVCSDILKYPKEKKIKICTTEKCSTEIKGQEKYCKKCIQDQFKVLVT